jgi:hypothetical protein
LPSWSRFGEIHKKLLCSILGSERRQKREQLCSEEDIEIRKQKGSISNPHIIMKN